MCIHTVQSCSLAVAGGVHNKFDESPHTCTTGQWSHIRGRGHQAAVGSVGTLGRAEQERRLEA